jgi:hypothetical protein
MAFGVSCRSPCANLQALRIDGATGQCSPEAAELEMRTVTINRWTTGAHCTSGRTPVMPYSNCDNGSA